MSNEEIAFSSQRSSRVRSKNICIFFHSSKYGTKKNQGRLEAGADQRSRRRCVAEEGGSEGEGVREEEGLT